MIITDGVIITDNPRAMGGTELIGYGLVDKVNPEVLKDTQIVMSRIRGELENDKVRIFVAHDLPGDPESDFLKDGGWKKFHKLVFVSNWQLQAYISYYKIPWGVCEVMKNAIQRFPDHEKPTDKIRLIYFSTPHRGLNILLAVFAKLVEKYDDIELDIYSSFSLYGWDDRDKDYEALFDQARNTPGVNYHGAVSNDEIREALKRSHILAYPCTWLETSCLVLMESMAAGLMCVHPNLGALPETSANWTLMYQFHEDLNEHANIFMNALEGAIGAMRERVPAVMSRLSSQAAYANIFYNWDIRGAEWESFLETLHKTVGPDRGIPEVDVPMFHYKVG